MMILTLALLAAPAPEPASLSARIDRLAHEPGRPVAGPSSDEEFLRRVTLDLTGTLPTSGEARAFLQDASAEKRRRLIDRLLASPEHARHLATLLDIWLMERRPDKHVPRAAWLDYLRGATAANRPWDALVRELLSADGADPKTRPSAKFYLEREGEPHLITRDVGRLFLGRNYQCAQCHDHPLVDDYKQEQYYGVFAFLNRSFLFIDKAGNLTVFAEKAEGEAAYQSVFDPKKTTRNGMLRVPGGRPVTEPAAEKGKEYVVAPAANVRPVPRFSRRAQLAGQVASADNLAFRRNLANRLWALLTGRGLVHPPDLDHPANPPSHPALLTMLADEAASSRFDMRSLLRAVVLSESYQRSSERPEGADDLPASSLAVARLRPLLPETFALSLMQATGLADAERLALGKNASEATLYPRLAANLGPFVSAFGMKAGHAEGVGFESTLDQALFLANGSTVRGWLTPRAGNLTDRLMKLKTSEAVAEELYLSVLTRRPTAEERGEVATQLERGGDRTAVLQELAWALLTSAEFRFNH